MSGTPRRTRQGKCRSCITSPSLSEGSRLGYMRIRSPMPFRVQCLVCGSMISATPARASSSKKALTYTALAPFLVTPTSGRLSVTPT